MIDRSQFILAFGHYSRTLSMPVFQ